jgi:hypothetical protein
MNQSRQQRRAEERRTAKQGTATVTTEPADADVANLPLLNDANIAAFRNAHGVETHDDLHQVMETRELLMSAHDALLAPPLGEDRYGDAIDGLSEAIETLAEVIAPTEQALSYYFVEDWAFEVIDGECRVRFAPLSAETWDTLLRESKE